MLVVLWCSSHQFSSGFSSLSSLLTPTMSTFDCRSLLACPGEDENTGLSRSAAQCSLWILLPGVSCSELADAGTHLHSLHFNTAASDTAPLMVPPVPHIKTSLLRLGSDILLPAIASQEATPEPIALYSLPSHCFPRPPSAASHLTHPSSLPSTAPPVSFLPDLFPHPTTSFSS